MANLFQESKMFKRQSRLCIRNFTYNTQETYLFDPSGCFVIREQFLGYDCR